MAKCKSGKCGCNARISSRAVSNMPCGCIDVCTHPICAEPNMLSIMAPLIYDEIGINLCTTFDIDTTISNNYPTATNATISVVDVSYNYGPDNVTIEAISGRPNCYLVTLTNLLVTFALNIYDSACRLLTTLYPTAVYLPGCTSAETYDEDTNPTAVELEIFAPYGPSYNSTSGSCTTPAISLNYIGFLSGNNYVRQGINLFALPKLLDFDPTDSMITVGLTLVLQSLYFAGYNVESAGKINTPKGSMTPDSTDCMNFVCGDLLNLAIKPLELGPPACEERLKADCNTSQSCGSCTNTSCASASPSNGIDSLNNLLNGSVFGGNSSENNSCHS